MQGEAERAGTVQPGEEESQEDLFDVYKYLLGGVKKMEPDSSWYCLLTVQEAMSTS